MPAIIIPAAVANDPRTRVLAGWDAQPLPVSCECGATIPARDDHGRPRSHRYTRVTDRHGWSVTARHCSARCQYRWLARWLPDTPAGRHAAYVLDEPALGLTCSAMGRWW